MPPLRIPSFLDLTSQDWPLRRLARRAGGRTAVAAGPSGPSVPPGPVDAAASGVEGARGIEGSRAIEAASATNPAPGPKGTPGPATARDTEAPQAADASPPVDAGPTLILRPLADRRIAFALRSKVGATLVTGESSTPCQDAVAFGQQVLAACAQVAHLRIVPSTEGPRLSIGDDALGLHALSRPTTGPAHAQALQRLISVQAQGASIRIDAH